MFITQTHRTGKKVYIEVEGLRLVRATWLFSYDVADDYPLIREDKHHKKQSSASTWGWAWWLKTSDLQIDIIIDILLANQSKNLDR